MTLAISAAPAAIPVKPKTAATSAMIKNVIVQRNIILNVWLTLVQGPITCQKENGDYATNSTISMLKHRSLGKMFHRNRLKQLKYKQAFPFLFDMWDETCKNILELYQAVGEKHCG